ncbi:MAG: TRAP transporter large permease [Eubacteriales bacterium]
MITIVVAFFALLAALILGIPVPFAFFASSVIVVIMGGYDHSFLLPYGYSKGSSIIICAIPLFVLAGGIMERGGIGEKLIDVVEVLVGRVRGGLGVVMVVSCAIFGAISGSGAATVTCIGSIMLPRMREAGYPRGHSAALIASAGVLGLLIPPSLTMILYAWVASTSVLASFLATVIPGIALVICFSLVNLFLLRKDKNIKVTENYNLPTTMILLGKKSFKAFPAIMAPVIILGGIYGGIMTPTEAAAISCIYSFPVGMFIYKGLTWKAFYQVLIQSVTTAGVILIMIISVQMLSRLYIMEQVPQKLMFVLNLVSENPIIILLMINLFLIIIGMLMDDISAILLCTPMLLPIVVSLGVTPTHFAAIIGVNLGLACVTPPCAPFLYLAGRIGKAPVNEMLKPTMYLIAFAWIPVLILTTYIPGLATWLPNLLLGGKW